MPILVQIVYIELINNSQKKVTGTQIVEEKMSLSSAEMEFGETPLKVFISVF